jgi:inosine-uridine nucleoside N-ribohydrolase
VILTTDCGVEVDDQWALAHLSLSPRIELRGVVTTHAPGFPAPSTEAAARAILAGLPLAHKVAVLPGSSQPLTDHKTPRPNAGVELLLSESKRPELRRRLVVLVIGAATDVASALLIDPGFADRVEVVAMGFDRWPEGGDPWNVKNDVHAWQVLLESRVPIVVGDVEICKKRLEMSVPTAHRLLDDSGATGRPLVALLESWLEKNAALARKATGKAGHWPIWDEVVVAHLFGLTESETHPRPRLLDDLTFDHSHPSGTIGWIRSVESEKLWADFAELLVRAARSNR